MALNIDYREYLKFLQTVKQTPERHIWFSYDGEADVLYINFQEAAEATDSELTDDDVIVRYDGDTVIGLTILHASQRNA